MKDHFISVWAGSEVVYDVDSNEGEIIHPKLIKLNLNAIDYIRYIGSHLMLRDNDKVSGPASRIKLRCGDTMYVNGTPEILLARSA